MIAGQFGTMILTLRGKGSSLMWPEFTVQFVPLGLTGMKTAEEFITRRMNGDFTVPRNSVGGI
jgi:hypothetical protein